jgi:hypothetical protein
VAEAFLKFLARINHAVASAVQMDCSTELAAALYGQIFLFLGEFLRDYVSKARCRLLYSHNEDFKSNFKNLVTSVENLAVMRLESACVDNSCTNYTLVDNAYFEKIGLEGQARKNASQTTTVLQLIWNTRQQKILNDRLAVGQAKILEEFLASLKAQIHQLDGGECRLLGSMSFFLLSKFVETDIDSRPPPASPTSIVGNQIVGNQIVRNHAQTAPPKSHPPTRILAPARLLRQ